MAPDPEYKPVPYLFKSRGLVARPIPDQAPEYTYIDFLNMLEREENSVSSRYGTLVINRDAVGAGTSNYFFTSPVTSLSRLVYQSNAWRYAGLQNGALYRRAGNTQGAYTSIYTGLSGNTFESLVTNCFQSSQGYLFIYDANASIKDMGTGTPQLTGIDPPPYTAMAIQYSPLLTMIDSFAAANSYSTSNVSGWANASVATLTAASGQIPTDFTEFFGIQPSGGMTYTPGTPTASASVTVTSGSNTNASSPVTGFSSVALSAGQSINVLVALSASVTVSGGFGGGGGGATFQYSVDSGATWNNFFAWGNSTTSSYIGPPTVSFQISGIANLNTVQLRVVANASTGGAPPPTVTGNGAITAVSATVTAPGVFGAVVSGMVSLLSTNSNTVVPITSITYSDLFSGLYHEMVITTASAHGLGNDNGFSIYGCSNPLLDGFYFVLSKTPTTITVSLNSPSPVLVTATGGYLNTLFGMTVPSACVLNNLYSTPYPSQFSAFGVYEQVPITTTSFPVGCWSGTVASNTVGTIGASGTFDLSIGNQVTDDDLIVLTMQVGSPANITNIRLQFDVDSSSYTSSYYYKDIAPAYYQGNIANTVDAYDATQQQILADTLGLITGAPPNSTTAQLQPSNFSTGSGAWTTIYMRRGDFLPVGNAGTHGLNWSNITGWQVVVTTGTTGSSTIAMNGLYLQWGYGPSSFGGVGYDYRYTYYNANTGTESSPSPIQNFNQQFGYLSTLAAPIFLRQAVQVNGYYSTDTQVTHVRMYRRGGIYSDNWHLIDQFPNVVLSSVPTFMYKDVIADATLAQAPTLALDNDPPVTSTLPSPISTTLAAATINLMGNSPYQPNVPPAQTVTTQNASAVFVPEQIVLVGNTANLEEVRVIVGGTGQFSAVFELQHNAGEPVLAYSTPRLKCTLSALANLPGGNSQVWLAGDPNNPHFAYYSKPGYPENFGPQNYVVVSAPDDPIMAIINWRGSIVFGTTKTWYILVGGAQPYAQPTGAEHGIVATNGWCEVEGAIWFQAADGLREFTGANGAYKTLPVEWIFRGNPLCIPPQLYQPDISQTIMAYYNNVVFSSYISNNAGAAGSRYRLNYDTVYSRYRYDDLAATAMLWEKDTNAFLIGKQIGAGQYAVVQDQVGDYDDGGWVTGALVQTPINLAIQLPYFDLGHPHEPKNWNAFEVDVNTQGQAMTSTLLIDNGPNVTMSNVSTTQRQKVELFVGTDQEGVQAYRASIRHTMAVTVAPILYQDDIYAMILAELSATTDTYWIKFGTDTDKFVKQGWFDYTSAVPIYVNLYADGNNTTPYFSFTLPAQANRSVQRVRFGNVNNGTTAFTLRTWRLVASTQVDADDNQYQMWAKPRIEWKTINAGSSYEIKELEV